MRVWGKARTAAEIGQDMTTELIGNESGLEADYPLDEGQGLTAHDQTPNGNDGTLAGLNGGLPAWVVPGNAGIDLGDNGITANSTRSGTAGALQFQGSSYVSLPGGLIDDAEPSETLEAWFQTTSGGVILGFQSSSASSDFAPDQWDPEIYVGTDGRLYAGAYATDLGSGEQVISAGPVDDGQWHEVALVIDGQSDTMTAYLDGQLLGTVPGTPEFYQGSFDQIGTGYTEYWAAAPDGWYGFVGEIDDVRVWGEARTAAEIGQDMTTELSGDEPGLEADYPLDEGQGVIAYDQTPNHDDGTLAGLNGDLPAWVVSGNPGLAPRPGPNNLQDFPIVVTTADGGLEGWLSGSAPDTTYRIDVYAGAGYSPGGGGQAQAVLGSLEVTTDGQGQVIFDIPFAAPPGLPEITATATDPQGDTSELSTARHPTLEAPTQLLPTTPGQPLTFASESGDGIAVQDPDAGPLDPAWDVTLDVASGTLTLSSLDGLVGSGNGTSSLNYQGPLSALNAALEGLSYSPAAGSHGIVTMTLEADSEGAPTVQAQILIIVDGTFTVTTTADSGTGSLRQAILASDAETGGTNAIEFDIPGQGVQTIAPLSPLPAITGPVLIDGTSQPGYAGTPLIELMGSRAGSADGLTITGPGVTVLGLDIGDFARAPAS